MPKSLTITLFSPHFSPHSNTFSGNTQYSFTCKWLQDPESCYTRTRYVWTAPPVSYHNPTSHEVFYLYSVGSTSFCKPTLHTSDYPTTEPACTWSHMGGHSSNLLMYLLGSLFPSFGLYKAASQEVCRQAGTREPDSHSVHY